MTAFFPHTFFLATAAGHGEQRATIFFAQILLLVAVGRLLGEWMQRVFGRAPKADDDFQIRKSRSQF